MCTDNLSFYLWCRVQHRVTDVFLDKSVNTRVLLANSESLKYSTFSGVELLHFCLFEFNLLLFAAYSVEEFVRLSGISWLLSYLEILSAALPLSHYKILWPAVRWGVSWRPFKNYRLSWFSFIYYLICSQVCVNNNLPLWNVSWIPGENNCEHKHFGNTINFQLNAGNAKWAQHRGKICNIL